MGIIPKRKFMSSKSRAGYDIENNSAKKGKQYMSAISDLKDQREEHDAMRANLSPDQNREFDELYSSGVAWHRVGLFAMLALGVGIFLLAIT